MNFRPNFLLALSVQLLCFVSVLEAYSNGSLTDACYTMAPVHGDAQPNTGPCLYETALSETTIVQGGSLTITLQNITNNSFRGYMTMAFDASKPDDAGPVGTFGMPTDGQILSCPDGANNTISHKDNNSLKRNVQANWTAPDDLCERRIHILGKGTVSRKCYYIGQYAQYRDCTKYTISNNSSAGKI
ncbi:hypothetical protein DAPPUDRAFT_318466 [Daphnia pulex]|uniref:Reelin domain-containing protein n=1 Tax=Daphnia pulex TaxID=6669 RepID=E9GIX8_DAPPU|nr:hypothetical protein DAPPUDRAFT_318466 [Daphnia pulex]|eukprot:EFX80343.1 hypothetical protein DAPPUDRAFT_318466 [Daphnia pulex]